MIDRKRKQISALHRIREHKERVARSNLESEIQDLLSVDAKAREKNALVQTLKEELSTGLEERLLRATSVIDPGARFTTFAMSVNAARENLLLEEGLASNLQEELKTVHESVAAMRQDLKVAYIQLQKSEHISQKLTDAAHAQVSRQEEASIEEIVNARPED